MVTYSFIFQGLFGLRSLQIQTDGQTEHFLVMKEPYGKGSTAPLTSVVGFRDILQHGTSLQGRHSAKRATSEGRLGRTHPN